ncbi:MAG: NADPH-dependent glutamate synthase [Chloroflexia bacterium]|nr:NADPH-dependent glutamate synthase [Chloroflexia bacterium]
MAEKEKKERIPRHEMPRQDPAERAGNFDEVALGYNIEMAMSEAQRCIQCKKPRCVRGCPVEVRIPQFILALREGNMPQAVSELKAKNNLPAICGRVCPQETQCEIQCVLGKKDEPVAIGRLERFVADWELSHPDQLQAPKIAPPSGKKVAIVGSGPAGLTCAADLARLGHDVIIYESLHAAGGVLVYGIPEFRLPKDIVQAEVDYVKRLGVDIRLNSVIGKLYTLDELLQEYDAIFLGTGAGLPRFMGIPGENLNGVYSANEFLTRTNLMKAYLFPEYQTPIKRARKVAVIGGGNVAMDSARCALRLGADEVHIVYRRSHEELPARAEEVENAEEEGIVFDLLTNPTRILGDDKGWVKAMECIRMELGEPDASGRRRPIPIEGSEFIFDCDLVVVAIGTSPNPLIFSNIEGLDRSRWGTVVADEQTGRTTKEGIWAGGDIVTGAATVISAMGAGKASAADMHLALTGQEPVFPEEDASALQDWAEENK